MSDLPLARFRATIHYDGTAFRGWQLQPDTRTVQGEIESALFRLLSAEQRVSAAGRTDTGVHAVGQEIALEAPRSWSPSDLQGGLNAMLPDDVRIESLQPAAADFHPRFEAVARRYEYVAGDGARATSPILRHRVWDLGALARGDLDEETLAEISRPLIGEHSFSAFAKAGQPERGTVCQVEEASWRRTGSGLLHFTIVADRFLHRMVRYLVATLVEVAADRRSREDLERLLAAGREEGRASVEGPRSPVPAPAWGLYLTGVRYAEGWNRPPGVPGFMERGGTVRDRSESRKQDDR